MLYSLCYVAGLGSSLTDLPDPLGMFLNQSDAWANTVAGSHVDPVPNSLVNLLIENPLGPQLDAALKSLPSIQVCSTCFLVN